MVCRRTGLSPDVVRVWERRYAAVAPSRSATNRRLYSDDDLEKLVLLRRATLAGRAIGHIARLGTEELRAQVEADEVACRAPGSTSSPSRLDACLEAVRGLDSVRLRSLLVSGAIEMGAPALMQDLVAPLMTAVGEQWQRGTLRIHHEHLATSLVRSLLESLRDGQPLACFGPELVVATLPGELHELGALMVAVAASADGWRVTFLGPDLPVEEIAVAVRDRGGRAVALSVVNGDASERAVDDLLELRRLVSPDIAILVGGRGAAACASALHAIGAIHVEDLPRFRVELRRLVAATP